MFPIAVNQRTATVTAGVVAVIEAARIGRNRARREESQLYVVARGERKIVIRCGIHDCVDLRGIGFQDGRGGGHFHRFTRLSNFHPNVDTGDLIQCKDKCRVRSRREPGLFDFEDIRANGQLPDTIKTGIVRRRGVSKTPLL